MSREITEAGARKVAKIVRDRFVPKHRAYYTVYLPDGWRFEQNLHCRVETSKELAEETLANDPIERCTDDCTCHEDD